MNKRFAMFVVLAVLFALAALPTASFAVGTGEVSTENTFITEGSTASKASPLIFKFDPNTEFKVGDQMEFALTNKATLANNINLIVGEDNPIFPAGNNSLTFYEAGGTLSLPDQSSDTSPLVTSGNVDVNITNKGVCFRFQGTAGSDKILMTVLGMPNTSGDGSLVATWGTVAGSTTTSQGTMSVTAAAGESGLLILRVFDLEVYTGQTRNIYLPTAGATANLGYTTPITDANDNALCIDVSAKDAGGTYYAENGENIFMNVDAGGKYTFNNAPYAIAYITGEAGIDRYESSKKANGFIPLGAAATQDSGGSPCDSFWNDAGVNSTYAATTEGFCATTHRANRVILRTSNGTPFSTTKSYKVKMEILVNDQAGDNGVYFAANGGGVPVLETATDDNGQDLVTVASTSVNETLGAVSAYRADGTTAVTATVDTSGTIPCTIPTANRAVILETAYQAFTFDNVDDSFIYFEMPEMVYDTALFQDGDVVKVRFELYEAPCGMVYNEDIMIATATDECSSAPVVNAQSLLFPYFPNPMDGILNVMYIVNNTDTAGDATITIYEQDGDAFSAKVTIAARGLAAVNVADFASLTDFAQIAGSGSFGDAPLYAVVNTGFATGGANLIYQVATGLAASYDVVAKP